VRGRPPLAIRFLFPGSRSCIQERERGRSAPAIAAQSHEPAPELLKTRATAVSTPVAAEMSTEQWTVRHRT
jgi:hypothetical protein